MNCSIDCNQIRACEEAIWATEAPEVVDELSITSVQVDSSVCEFSSDVHLHSAYARDMV